MLTERWSFGFSVREFRSAEYWQGGLRRERVANIWGPIQGTWGTACARFRFPERFAHQLVSRTSMPSLTPAERDALRCAVSVHGRAWDVIVASGACPGRGARTLRWNWGEICKEGVVAAAGLAAEPVWHPLVEGPGLPVVPLPDKLRAKTARCIHSGRPWNYIVQRGGVRDDARTSRT